jgi:hypothetical protein
MRANNDALTRADAAALALLGDEGIASSREGAAKRNPPKRVKVQSRRNNLSSQCNRLIVAGQRGVTRIRIAHEPQTALY